MGSIVSTRTWKDRKISCATPNDNIDCPPGIRGSFNVSLWSHQDLDNKQNDYDKFEEKKGQYTLFNIKRYK